MTFIVILITLAIERFFDWTHIRQWRWFSRYRGWLGKFVTNSPLFFIAAALPLLLVVAALDHLFSGWLFGLFKLILSTIVLVYCLGPQNLWSQLYGCFKLMNKDEPAAGVEHAQAAFGLAASADSHAFHQGFVRAIFVAANQRVFAVLFWFAILGPVGALLYRLAALCNDRVPSLQRLLDWLPVRFFGFIFALGGHFTEVMKIWKQSLKQGFSSNETVIADCGVAALNKIEEESAEKQALGLIDRVLVMGLVFLAVVVLLA